MKKTWNGVKRLLGILEWSILVVAIITLAYVVITTRDGKAAEFFGKSILHIVTGSMEPTISVDDYVWAEKLKDEDIKKDDIVAYYSENPKIYGKLVIHRIIQVNDDGTYIAKGDANLVPDEMPVKKEQIVGRYKGRIEFLNWIKSFMNVQKLLLLIVTVPIFLISVYEFATVTKLFYKKKEELDSVDGGLDGQPESYEDKVERLKKEAIEEYIKNHQEESNDDSEANEKE